MYNDKIKEILKETYEIYAHTLDYDSVAERGNKLYFYTLDSDYEKEIVSVRDALNNQLTKSVVGQLTELKQLLPGDKWNLPQCACYTENNGEWELTFHLVKGVRYHRTFGKRVVATLMLQETPLVALSEQKKDTLYGYWDETSYDHSRNRGADQVTTDGMNYRVNRNLISNEQFRKFTIELFSTIAIAENKYILKDIGRTIAEWGYFLPSITFKNVIKSHTPQELLGTFVPASSLLNMNFNRLDMNVGYVIATLAPVISKCDWPDLISITPDIIKKCFSLKNIFDGFKSFESIEVFLVNYYRYARRFSDMQIDDYIQDYVNMCLCCNEPIKLSSSFKKLVEAHDAVAQTMRNRKYPEAEINL